MGSDRGANGVTQDDVWRWHWNVLRSVWLSVQDSQIPPDAHDRGISRLRTHGEAHRHGCREREHVAERCVEDGTCGSYDRISFTLHSRRDERPPKQLVLGASYQARVVTNAVACTLPRRCHRHRLASLSVL